MWTVSRGSSVLWLLAELSMEEPQQEIGGGRGEGSEWSVPGRGPCSVIADFST